MVNITASDAKLQETSIVKTIDVESYLCGMDGINGGRPVVSAYKIGQDFRVCVRPTQKYSADYSVVSFKNVTCGYRTLVSATGLTDILTKVITNLTGSRSATGMLIGNSSAAFTSVITAGYFDGSKTSFTCDGEAILSFSGRRLTTSFSHLSLGKQDSSRALQEATVPAGSPFATTIDLLSDSADVDALAAPGFTTSQGSWSLLIVGAAVMMVGVF